MPVLYINVMMPTGSGKQKETSIKNTSFTYLGVKGWELNPVKCNWSTPPVVFVEAPSFGAH